VQPVHVAGYIEQLQGSRSAPTVKQHLACIRMLFDWLVTGQVVPSNPAHAVRGPRHSVRKGSTTVMSSEDTSAFLKTIDTSHVVGLRDRALIAVMVFAFALVSAVVGLKVEDYFPLKKRWWLRLHEKAARSMKWAATTSSLLSRRFLFLCRSRSGPQECRRFRGSNVAPRRPLVSLTR
jgi:integrase/recombinase XerD